MKWNVLLLILFCIKPTYIAYVLNRNSQVTYYACAMYIDRSEFNRSPKPTVAPIFRSHRIRENCFPFHEMPQKCTFAGWGHFRKMFIFTDRSCETSFERSLSVTTVQGGLPHFVHLFWHSSRPQQFRIQTYTSY